MYIYVIVKWSCQSLTFGPTSLFVHHKRNKRVRKNRMMHFYENCGHKHTHTHTSKVQRETEWMNVEWRRTQRSKNYNHRCPRPIVCVGQKQAKCSDNNVVILTVRYVLCADKSGYICGRRIGFKARWSRGLKFLLLRRTHGLPGGRHTLTWKNGRWKREG